MTIITTPSLQKPYFDSHTVKVETGDNVWDQSGGIMRRSTALLCMTVIALAVAGAGILCGVGLYREYLKSNPVHRYQGFCSIPVDYMDDRDDDQQSIEPHYRVMPLRWSSDPDVQVFSTAEEASSDDFIQSLREELDIGDTVEKISVFNGPNGRQTSFIHDFGANVSGIVDDARCFLMELDRDLVLPPPAFVLTIEGNGEFEVSRVRNTMRALLPPMMELARLSREIANKCLDRPTYKLQKQEGITIRKRSVDGPVNADYTHFSGHHVQEIDINNLADLVAYESNA